MPLNASESSPVHGLAEESGRGLSSVGRGDWNLSETCVEPSDISQSFT